MDARALHLRVVQPALIGLIDGTISTLAPIFAAAYVSGSRAALLGAALTRGLITGVATFVGGVAHALPFLIANVHTALLVAYPVVAADLVLIALIRKRFQRVSMRRSLIQVTLGGALVAAVGVILGHS
jgi:VIT1/CCC1 family predicted Fe2+/Mn2+ transporter